MYISQISVLQPNSNKEITIIDTPKQMQQDSYKITIKTFSHIIYICICTSVNPNFGLECLVKCTWVILIMLLCFWDSFPDFNKCFTSENFNSQL